MFMYVWVIFIFNIIMIFMSTSILMPAAFNDWVLFLLLTFTSPLLRLFCFVFNFHLSSFFEVNVLEEMVVLLWNISLCYVHLQHWHELDGSIAAGRLGDSTKLQCLFWHCLWAGWPNYLIMCIPSAFHVTPAPMRLPGNHKRRPPTTKWEGGFMPNDEVLKYERRTGANVLL